MCFYVTDACTPPPPRQDYQINLSNIFSGNHRFLITDSSSNCSKLILPDFSGNRVTDISGNHNEINTTQITAGNIFREGEGYMTSSGQVITMEFSLKSLIWDL